MPPRRRAHRHPRRVREQRLPPCVHRSLRQRNINGCIRENSPARFATRGAPCYPAQAGNGCRVSLFPETRSSMTNSVQSPEPTQDGGSEVEVIKDLEQRGFHALDSLSLEELQLLTERKRRQLQWEAAERKTQLETEISSIDQQIEELGTRKVALTEELNAVM